MSYEAQEALAQGEPFELFKFVGFGRTWTFTPASQDIIYQLETYTSTNITAGRRRIKTELSQNDLTIEVPTSLDLIGYLIQPNLDAQTVLTVYRGYGSDVVVWWQGIVMSTSVGKGSSTIRCEPLNRSLRRKTLRLRILTNCRHIIYDDMCTVDRNAYRTTGTIDSVDALFRLSAPGIGAQADGYYRGGMIEISGTPRGDIKTLVLSHTGSQVKVQTPLTGVTAGLQYSIFPGCNHRIAGDCHNKFNNRQNYGGFVGLPRKNPFVGDSI